MFRGLVPPPPTSSVAYQELKQKVDEYVYQPPSNLTLPPDILVCVIENHERCIHDLLERRAQHQKWLPNRNREKRIDFLERQIDEELASARAHVRRVVLHRLRRLICCIIIQRTMLRHLYAPNGSVPVISNELKRAGFVGDDGAFGSIDDGTKDEL